MALHGDSVLKAVTLRTTKAGHCTPLRGDPGTTTAVSQLADTKAEVTMQCTSFTRILGVVTTQEGFALLLPGRELLWTVQPAAKLLQSKADRLLSGSCSTSVDRHLHPRGSQSPVHTAT